VFLYVQRPQSVSTPVIPVSMSNALLFTPFVPGWLPEGYAVEAGSYSVSGQVLVFSAVKKGAQPIAFSQQAFPKNFDVNGFYESNLNDAKRLDGAKRPTVFGGSKTRDGKVASVTAGDTWVIITLPQTIKENDVRRIVDALAQSR